MVTKRKIGVFLSFFILLWIFETKCSYVRIHMSFILFNFFLLFFLIWLQFSFDSHILLFWVVGKNISKWRQKYDGLCYTYTRIEKMRWAWSKPTHHIYIFTQTFICGYKPVKEYIMHTGGAGHVIAVAVCCCCCCCCWLVDLSQHNAKLNIMILFC